MSVIYVNCKKVNDEQGLQISELYHKAGWVKKSDLVDIAWLGLLISGSSVFIIAVDEQTSKIIGIGRAISDNSSDSYIQDVFVLPEYRGLNFGIGIIKKIISELKNKGVSWIGLIAQPGGSVAFYKKIGFKIMQDHTPMLLDQDLTK